MSQSLDDLVNALLTRRTSDGPDTSDDESVDTDASDDVAVPLHPQRGRIDLITGCMFAGKSVELLRLVRRFTIANKTVAVINHKKDDRHGGNCIGTHDAATHRAKTSKTLLNAKVEALVQECDVVAIDEAQFFPDLVTAATAWADSGKIVIVAALDSTFERKPFDNMIGLVPDSITHLTAVCFECGHDASFSHRTTPETEIELVGAEELYQAVCRPCYVKLNA